MEKIKDFLRNAAIPIVGGIIGAFIGIQDMEEPAVNMAAGDFHVDVTGGEPDEGKSGSQNVPDEQKEIPGASGSGQAAGTSDGSVRNREK